MASLLQSSSISEIVRSDYRTVDVFNRYQISFCGNNGETLSDVCRMKQLDYHRILAELEDFSRDSLPLNNLQFNEWKVDFLIDYIINIHHAYIYRAIPMLETQMLSVEIHQDKYPELLKIKELLPEMSRILLAHCTHEEGIIFPYIKQIDIAHKRNESYGNIFVRTLRKPLNTVEKEHQLIYDLLGKLKGYTNNFLPPEKACTSHQVFYYKLREFYCNLLEHERLENNYLFPKAIDIEENLLRI